MEFQISYSCLTEFIKYALKPPISDTNQSEKGDKNLLQ